MSKKFIVFSDQHLEQALFNLPELKQDLFDKYEEVINAAISLKVDYVVSVGDLFDINKPSYAAISFVQEQNNKLIEAGILPLAISGDHSNSLDGKSWEQVCGFMHINKIENFIGIDWNSNSDIVKNKLFYELDLKKDEVEFIFLHQQIPQLFGFCEDKKKLDLNWEEICKEYPTIKACFFGDIHNGNYTLLSERQFFGYCGSMGATKLDELDNKKLIYFDGKKVNLLPSELSREFYILTITSETIDKIIKKDLIAKLNKLQLKCNKLPICIIKYEKGLYGRLNEFNYLYDYAIVRSSVLLNKDIIENINIRSEISGNSNVEIVLEETLKENGCYSKEIYDIGLELLSSLRDNSTKEILNKVKKEYIK